MRCPKMWYVRPAKAQTSPTHTHSLIRAFASRSLSHILLVLSYSFEGSHLKGGYTDLSKSKLVKIPYCWKSHVTAHISHLLSVY